MSEATDSLAWSKDRFWLRDTDLSGRMWHIVCFFVLCDLVLKSYKMDSNLNPQRLKRYIIDSDSYLSSYVTNYNNIL